MAGFQEAGGRRAISVALFREYHDFMNKARLALFLLLASAWLGAAGHRALAAQLVPLGPEEEVPSDIFSNVPAVAAQPMAPL